MKESDIHDTAMTTAAQAFAALGSEQRLQALLALVRAGPDGLRMGELSEATGIAASTLTHHLRFLTSAGLVTQTRKGRVIRCAVNYDVVRGLSDYLLSECCADAADPHAHHDHQSEKADKA